MTTIAERIARIRETHVIVYDFPECPNCGEGCPGHGEIAFCETCLNDEGPCDVLVVVAELEKAGAAT